MAAGTEAERDALKEELDKLRKSRVTEAMAASSQDQGPRIDSKGLEDLRLQLEEARRQAEARLSDVVAERARSAKISEELQQRVADLSRLSTEKLQLQYEKNSAESSLLLVKEERDQLQHSKDEEKNTVEEVRRDLSSVTVEREKLFREREDMRRKFSSELEAAHAEVRHHQRAAEDAREAHRSAQQEAASAEKRIRDKAEEFAEERAAIERKLDLRAEQLRRTEDLQSTAERHLAETAEDLKSARATAEASASEAAALREQNVILESKFKELEAKHEELLCRHIPGAGSQSLAGFASVSELVQEASTARTQALQERQERQRLQDVLVEVEKEVRARYPALASQRDEAERLRDVSNHLTQQNEGLLGQLQDLERSQQDAENHARQSQRLNQILEAHARDMAKQLAVLVHENRKLTGSEASNVGGLCKRRGLGGLGSLDASELESDSSAYRSVQDLTDQNETLRKKVARLTEECDTAAQQELATLRREQSQQIEEWRKHLADKAEQTKALVDMNERLAKERDGALQSLKEQKEASSPADAGGPVPQREVVPREHLTAVREEFSKCSEVLHREAKEARASEFAVRRSLATTQAQLDFEVSRKKDMEVNLKLVEKKLEEKKALLETKAKREATMEASLREEEAARRDLEASLGQGKRDAGQLQTQAKMVQSKLEHIQKSNVALLAERAAQGQLTVDLQARLAQESGSLKDMKHNLDASYRREDGRLKEQLELAEQRVSDARKTIEELGNQCTSRGAEANEARARLLAVEDECSRVKSDLAERTVELEDLRAAAAPRLRRGADTEAAESEAQLQRSRLARDRDPEIAKLQQRLAFAEQMEQEHARSSERWKALLGQHEKDLAAGKAVEEEVRRQLEELREEHGKFDDKTDQANKRQLALEESARELNQNIDKLQASLAKKEEELVEARLEGDRKAQDASHRLQALQRQQEGSVDDAGSWQRKHREAVSAHALDIELLNQLGRRAESLDKELKQAQSSSEQLRDEVASARAQKSDDAADLRQRLAQAEEASRSLEAENRKYQEHLLAMSGKQAGSGAQEEAVQRVAGEMKRARELGELKRQEVELDRDRLQREVCALRAEATGMQARLDKEQGETLRLQAAVGREERAMAKMAQLSLMEDENRRLAAEVGSLGTRLEEATASLATKSCEMEPLSLRIREYTRKEEDADRGRQALEARVDEWKRLHDEVVQKFDAVDVGAHKKLKEDHAKNQEKQQSLQRQVEKLQADLKVQAEQQKSLKVAAGEAESIKKRSSEFERQLKEATTKVSQLTKEKALSVQQVQEQSVEVKRLGDLKSLRDKAIADLQAKFKTVQEEHNAAAAQAKTGAQAKATAASAANAAAVQKKLEDDLKLAQGRADRALSLAMDFQRVVEAMAAKLEQERLARERSREPRAQGTGAQSAPLATTSIGGSGGAFGVTRAATTDDPKSAASTAGVSPVSGLSGLGAGLSPVSASASYGAFGGSASEPPKSATAGSPGPAPAATGSSAALSSGAASGGVKRTAEHFGGGASPSVSESGSAPKTARSASGSEVAATMGEPTNHPVPAKKLPAAKSMFRTQVAPASSSAGLPGTTFSTTPSGTAGGGGGNPGDGAPPTSAPAAGASRGSAAEPIDLELGDSEESTGATEPPQHS